MDKKEFGNVIRERVTENYGDKAEVRLQEVRKNNNVKKLGILVNEKEKNVAPTLYLDSFYQDYETGRDLEDIVDAIMENLRKGMPTQKIDMEFFQDFDNVKDKICYKLINGEMNEDILGEIPFIPYLDLAICFYYPFWNEEIGSGSILIRNEHVMKWGTSVKELWKTANENTRRLYPESCAPMDAVLLEMTGREKEEWPALPKEEGWGYFPMKVLTNRQRTFGAAVILYEKYLERLAERLRDSFFLIPCSVHEVLIVPAVEGQEDGLVNVILQANENNLEREDVLSDHLYLYDAKQKKLSVIP